MDSPMTLTDGLVLLLVAAIVLFCIICVFHVAIEFMLEMIDQETKQNDKDTNNQN